MTEESPRQSKNHLLSILVIFLIAVAGVQTWYMMNMKQTLDTPGTTDQSSVNRQDAGQTTTQPISTTPSIALQNTPPVVIPDHQQQQPATPDPIQAFDDNFLNYPFASRDWNPDEMITRMQQDMDRILNGAFGQLNSPSGFSHGLNATSAIPELNLSEDNSKFTVTMALPDSRDKNVSVNLDGQLLTISGKQSSDEQKQDDQGNVIFQQHRSEQFQRSITLPQPVKPGSLASHVDHSVLTITVTKMS